ncbi:hypothetical protein [Fodinicola acaciae]|nr:hypothetical protein [Fodinicola acaciae]
MPFGRFMLNGFLVAAGGTILVLTIVLVLALQRRLVRGIALSGLGGR